jgi:RNA polymerase sigma-70 factor (ECF subfamily)
MKTIKKTYKELALEFKNTGSIKAYNQLYEKIKPGLWNYIFKIVKDPDVTNDITSTTLTKVYLKIDQYNEDYQITTWAYRIAFNEALGHLRKNRKKVNIGSFSDKGFEPTSKTGKLSFQEPLIVEESYTSTEEKHKEADRVLTKNFNKTISAIKELDVLYKDYIEERFINGKTYNDILDIMSKKEKNITLQTVKNRIFRGRKIIQKQLKESLESLSV